MTLQTAVPIGHLGLKTTYLSARELVRLAGDGLMTADLPYQRGSVWTRQRIALIESWLLATPIPAGIINDRDSPGWYQATGGSLGDGPCYAVIDGKQRIETAAAWFAVDIAHLPRATARVPTVAAEAAIYLRVNRAGAPQSAGDHARAAAIAAGITGER